MAGVLRELAREIPRSARYGTSAHGGDGTREDRDPHAPDADLTKALTKRAAEKGLRAAVLRNLRNVIRFLVPLTASDAIVPEGWDRGDALRELTGSLRSGGGQRVRGAGRSPDSHAFDGELAPNLDRTRDPLINSQARSPLRDQKTLETQGKAYFPAFPLPCKSRHFHLSL